MYYSSSPIWRKVCVGFNSLLVGVAAPGLGIIFVLECTVIFHMWDLVRF